MDTPSIDSEIQRTLESLSGLEVDSDDYEVVLKRLERLYEMKKKVRISPEALINAGTSLAGILLVLNYEKLNVVTSRALMFIKRST